MSQRQRRSGSEAKVVIYTRISPATVAALDEICESMRPKPTRAQLIDAALAEYVERHGEKMGPAGAARPRAGGETQMSGEPLRSRSDKPLARRTRDRRE
jgi:hypothetical protein